MPVSCNGPSSTAIYTLSLHDALPIWKRFCLFVCRALSSKIQNLFPVQQECRDRKSGSAGMPRPISYAVFCLKKKADYSAIVDGPPLKVPGNARIVFWTVVNYEGWDIG